ncbi:MAG: tRNA1(Val) (adenine(37)-N6)-methyltransferase [Bacteroidales bacterium]|jgi:tRNA1Val (adenine37-N6)-methyltransferase|nr:tRNA1(Val) (adenine(37)-N6)-methyltransferase [Bacteroidales bacterium]
MSNDFFRFKQFTIRQSQAAMKVGVDSVLLGAWADVSQANRVLDIGTGTGLLALMLAQRIATPDAQIDAVEIDANACSQARENVAASAWSGQINIYCDDFRHFAAHTHQHYDLIISNPPYFSNSLKSSDSRRCLARHNDSLLFLELMAGAAKLLTPEGKIAVVLPVQEADSFTKQATQHGLSVCRRLYIRSTPAKQPYCLLLELSGKKTPPTEQHLCIYDAQQAFTNEYIELTKSFYLKMRE